jgi:hypothetical protein
MAFLPPGPPVVDLERYPGRVFAGIPIMYIFLLALHAGAAPTDSHSCILTESGILSLLPDYGSYRYSIYPRPYYSTSNHWATHPNVSNVHVSMP